MNNKEHRTFEGRIISDEEAYEIIRQSSHSQFKSDIEELNELIKKLGAIANPKNDDGE